MRYLILIISSLCVWLPLLSYADNQTALKQQRIIFQQAKKALETQQLARFNTLKQQLDGYPLQSYLDYLYLRHRLNQVDSMTIVRFIEHNEDSFYSERLRSAWLKKLAKNKQWHDFLAYYRTPQSNSNQCLHLQALINTDNSAQAFKDIIPLWLVPKSQVKACDPAFQYWQQQGLLTDDLRWQRIHLALQANQYSLATYLAKSLKNPTETRAWIALWQKMHQNPLALLKNLPNNTPTSQSVSLYIDVPLSREIIKHGLSRLTRKSTNKAYASWMRIEPAYNFNEQDKIDVRHNIALQAALSREDRSLEFFGDLSSEPWRVRAALWQQDWPAVETAIASLTPEQQQHNRWQYWLGRSQQQQGKQLEATNTFQNLVPQRDYYSFLAADQLQQPYQMNHHPIIATDEELSSFAQQPAVLRLQEFYALDMQLEARRQAYKLKQTLSNRNLQLLATLTAQWGWHNQTIALLGKAKYWDALDLRFPLLYNNEILEQSKVTGISPSWLLGVTRQESAFNPKARSHVGAMGLMQLMPKTGELIAKLIQKPLKSTSELYEPSRNIQLGSAYLRRMYDTYQQNPVLATASYNAGPHRIKRWLTDHDLPTDIWVENIPFKETRRYTRSVLSYTAIFDYQRQQTIVPISKHMPIVQAK